MHQLIDFKHGVAACVVLGFIAGCAMARPPAQAKIDPVHSELRLEHQSGKDAWLLTYAFSAPVFAITFLRPEKEWRRNGWKLLTPGLAMAHAGKQEQVRALDGKPFLQMVFEIPTYAKKADRD